MYKTSLPFLIILLSFFYYLVNSSPPSSQGFKANDTVKSLSSQNQNRKVDSSTNLINSPLTFQQSATDNNNGLYQTMSLTSYKGSWKNLNANNTKLFDSFLNNEGIILLDFNGGIVKRNRAIWYEEQTEALNILSQVNLVIVDGEYYDEQMYFISFEDIPPENFVLSPYVLSIKGTDEKIGNQEGCNLDLQIDFSGLVSSTNENPEQDNVEINENGVILIKMTSSNCAINFDATVNKDTSNYTKIASNATIFKGSVFLVIFITNLLLIKGIFSYRPEINQIPTITPVLLAIWDLVFLLNVHTFTNLNKFDLTLIIFCIECILFMFSSILLLSTPMMRNAHNMKDDITVSEFLHTAVLYGLPPILIMLILIAISESCFFNPIFLFITNLYLIPQIVHHVTEGTPASASIKLCVYTISLRPLLPLYLKGHSNNLYNISTSIPLAIGIIIVVLVQIILVCLQEKLGPRFFLPKDIFPPEGYNYETQPLLSSFQGTELVRIETVCDICKRGLLDYPHIDKNPHPKVRTTLNRLKLRAEKLIKAECQHKFHAFCLVERTLTHGECPTCGCELKRL